LQPYGYISIKITVTLQNAVADAYYYLIYKKVVKKAGTVICCGICDC